MKILKLLFFTLTAILVMSQAIAHHSTRGIYHDDQTMELKGIVKEWAFINPHPYLTISATDENGVLRDWDVSYGGAAVIHLQRQGYASDTFKLGEVITIHGSPARKAGVYGILMEGGENHPTREDGSPVVAGGSMF
ncbi:MAG: DUF6152 family protein [Gammaproteobacteria bacterium]|nr:DUF6152 family protein [Gammaproteobacteria bacterium]